ncbi:MAG: DUF1080 domain-containing protein [Planctomycetia bacterium]|nr:DUF1080 domain-containing protein [Planctomycetia bacterium]
MKKSTWKSVFVSLVACAMMVTGNVAANAADNQLSDAEKADGFELIFNGENLDGWRGDTKGYVVEDGVIVCKPGGNLYLPKDYKNFVIRFDFQVPPGGNNGLGIRAEMGKDAAYHGMEIQILDDYADCYKTLQPYQYHGSIYGVVPVKRGFTKPAGEWNTEEVMADGGKIRVTVNGEVVTEADISEIKETMDHRDHPGLHNESGAIGFLGHGARVMFKNVRVKELD